MSKKKDFTSAAQGAFSGGSIIDRLTSPTQRMEMQAADLVEQPAPAYRYKNKSGSETRVTFMLSEANMNKLQLLCEKEGRKQKHIINEALKLYFYEYEKKYGSITAE